MKAFVTGSAGFVGRHVVAELERRGWEVWGCDTDTRSGIVMPEDDAHWHFRHNTHRYDLVVHAAASAPHRTAIDQEHGHMARNLMLDAAMFEWAARTRQRQVIYLSSSAAYPVVLQNETPWPLAEDDIDLDDGDEPDAVYGWTKLTGERLAREARRDGLKVAVVRPFSGYGSDQSLKFPFRAILERVRGFEDPIDVWGSGLQVRDWIHISDVVSGMLAVAESGTADPVNLGTGRGVSMFDLAGIMAKQAGHQAVLRGLPGKPSGVQERVADVTRMRRIYVPRVELEEGIARALRA